MLTNHLPPDLQRLQSDILDQLAALPEVQLPDLPAGALDQLAALPEAYLAHRASTTVRPANRLVADLVAGMEDLAD